MENPFFTRNITHSGTQWDFSRPKVVQGDCFMCTNIAQTGWVREKNLKTGQGDYHQIYECPFLNYHAPCNYCEAKRKNLPLSFHPIPNARGWVIHIKSPTFVPKQGCAFKIDKYMPWWVRVFIWSPGTTYQWAIVCLLVERTTRREPL